MCSHACPCGIYPFLHPFSPRKDDWGHPTVLVRNGVHTCDNYCGWNAISGIVIICVWISMGHTKVNVKRKTNGGDMVGLSSLTRTREEPPATPFSLTVSWHWKGLNLNIPAVKVRTFQTIIAAHPLNNCDMSGLSGNKENRLPLHSAPRCMFVSLLSWVTLDDTWWQLIIKFYRCHPSNGPNGAKRERAHFFRFVSVFRKFRKPLEGGIWTHSVFLSMYSFYSVVCTFCPAL